MLSNLVIMTKAGISVVLPVVAAGMLALASAADARDVPVPPTAAGTYRQVTVPGATQTTPESINDLGVIVGCFHSKTGKDLAFVDRGGSFTRFSDPVAGTGSHASTCALGISNGGEIVGSYAGGSGASHGFIDRHGRFSTIIVAHAAQAFALAVNRSGVVVGGFLSGRNVEHGFVLKGGQLTVVNAPGAARASFRGTILNGIADDGTMSGTYSDAKGTLHGFTYLDGVFTPVNVPGAATTAVACISERSGLVIGVYRRLASSHDVGFTDNGGQFRSLRDPLATLGTVPQCGNDAGRVVGYYLGAGTSQHGFRFAPASTVPALSRSRQPTSRAATPGLGLGLRFGQPG